MTPDSPAMPQGAERPVKPAFDLRRALLESVVIVTSILLAFGVDAWWEDRREAADTRESLEVVRRDLVDTLTQLAEFEAFSNQTATTSLASARTLLASETVPVQSRPALVEQLLRSSSRRTMRLPRAGYTDLLNTGNIQEIDNRPLRDRLVRFYEAADRSQEIIEKNSSLFTDQLLKDALFGEGLLYPKPQALLATEIQQHRDARMLEHMGPDFPERTQRIWRLPSDSIEIDRLIAALMQNARSSFTAEVLVQETQVEARELLRLLDAHLAGLQGGQKN